MCSDDAPAGMVMVIAFESTSNPIIVNGEPKTYFCSSWGTPNSSNGCRSTRTIFFNHSIISTDVLHAVVSRLDDYTEHVLVEVEIRISDEEVLAKGYEVLRGETIHPHRDFKQFRDHFDENRQPNNEAGKK
jgi:hypothetical protein